jgi:hypothetical protein
MKQISISKEQAKAFAIAFPIEEMKRYISANRKKFMRFCAKEEEKRKQTAPPPKKSRVSRKGVK